MAIDEKLAEKVRAALAHIPAVEEKKMFRGLTFMVNGKMCVSVGASEYLFRIAPDAHAAAVRKKGCRTMEMGGREYIGYVFVAPEGYKSKKDFDFWMSLALDFNKVARPAPRKKSKAKTPARKKSKKEKKTSPRKKS